MWAFFRTTMSGQRDAEGKLPEEGGDFARFQEYVNSPEHPIDAEVLGDIIKDMVEFTTGRPTERASSSTEWTRAATGAPLTPDCSPLTQSTFRPGAYLNVAHGIITDALAYAEDETREAFHQEMEWPELVTEELQAKQDQSARHAAQLHRAVGRERGRHGDARLGCACPPPGRVRTRDRPWLTRTRRPRHDHHR